MDGVENSSVSDTEIEARMQDGCGALARFH